MKDRTDMEVKDVITLLEFTLTTTYFLFDGQIFHQKFGTVMGSSVSPTVAYLYMEWLEQKAVATAPLDCHPRLWKRYVDDILEIIKKRAAENLTAHLYKIDNTGNIKFTYELENDGKPKRTVVLPFIEGMLLNHTKPFATSWFILKIKGTLVKLLTVCMSSHVSIVISPVLVKLQSFLVLDLKKNISQKLKSFKQGFHSVTEKGINYTRAK